MKIAVIGSKRVPSNLGGVEKTAEMQAVYLQKLGHEPVIYNRGRRKPVQKVYRGIRLVDIPTPKGAAGVPVYTFLSLLHALTYADVILFHASGPCNMIRIAHLFHRPCIGILHGFDSQRAKWGRFASWYLRSGEKAALSLADRCFVLSENMQREAEAAYGRRPDILHNGIDTPAGKDPAVLSEPGLQEDEYILTAVRIVPEKGLDILIPAFKACKTAKKLVIAGGEDPRCREYYRHLQELTGQDPRILFAGHRSPEEMNALYEGCYMFVLPSRLEGMSNALLEAMAEGCCVLVSDIAENTEVVQTHGMAFRTGDAADLQEKLQDLLDDAEKVRKYRHGVSEYVLQKYSWQKAAEILAQSMKEITDDKQ